MIRIASVAMAVLLTASQCADAPKPEPTKSKTASAQRPPKPHEGREVLRGCPVNGGTVEDSWVGEITESPDSNRIGLEAVFILRWVPDRDHPSGAGGCWQQTAFTAPNALDRFENCVKGARWSACAKD